MLWYCAFKWHPHTTREHVAQRIVQQHEAGTNHPESIKGWYNLAGGGAGFLLIETDDPRQLTTFLQPYMDLVSFDVHAAYPVDYQKQLQEFRQLSQHIGVGTRTR